MSEKKANLDATVQTQLASLTLENATMKKELDAKLEENKELKKQCVQLASVIENELKSDLMVKIMAKGDYKQADLEALKIEELQHIDETLSKVKGASAIFNPIRTASEPSDSRLTVGSLYGLTRAEILAKGGEH
jgi:hypothetical protein